MQKNKIKIIYQTKTLLIVLITFCFFAVSNTSFAQSFMGPSCAAGQCQGKIGVDSSGNVSMGTSTPQSGTRTLIISQTSDSSTYGLKILSSNNSPLLLVRSDGRVSIATSSANYILNVSGDIYASGNVITGGTVSSAVPAGNVTPGVFNSLQGGGTGAYAFLGSLGVATSSQVGLPQNLSVYGGGYFSGNVGIGTTAPGGRLDISGGYSSGAISAAAGLAIAANGTSPDRAQIWWGDNTGWKLHFGTRSGGNFQPRVTIVDTGNFGIGTTAPLQRLHVSGGNLQLDNNSLLLWRNAAGSGNGGWVLTSGNDMEWRDPLSGQTTFTIDVGGNVGIGTTGPGEKLEVAGNVKITGSRIKSSAGYGIVQTDATDWLRINPDSNYPAIALYNPVAIGTGGLAIGEWSQQSSGVLKVTQSAYLATGGGNVGIGTTAPAQKLHVEGRAYISDYIAVGTTTATNAKVQINSNDAIVGKIGIGGPIYRDMWFDGGSDGIFVFYNTGSSGGGTLFAYDPDPPGGHTEIMFISNGGQVGVGTKTPYTKFDVRGGISWGDSAQNVLSTNQGGSIELGGRGDLANPVSGGTPFIDFHYGTVSAQDFNFRIINSADNRLDFGSAADGTFVTFNSGFVGIGITSPAYRLDVSGNIRTSGCLIYNGGTLGTCVSDIRLKENIMDLTFDNAIEKVLKLHPKKFVLKKDPTQEMTGLIAQEVEEFAPELITTDQNGYKQIKYGDIQWLTIKAVQELTNKVIQLEKDNQNLRQEIQKLKER